MGLLDGKVAIVTGAGRGLGRGEALELAREGAGVVVGEVDEGAGQAVVDEITASGGTAVLHVGDCSEIEHGQGIVRTAVEQLGRLDALVNNAGILRDRTLAKMTPDEWDAVIKVHLRGHYAPTHAAVDHWRGQGSAGHVVCTASTSGILGNFGQSNYGAAKAGIAAFAQIVAQENWKHGITVNAICPAARTRMTEGAYGDRISDVDGAERDFDFWHPDNVAPFVAFLCSDASSGISGKVFGVQGDAVELYRPFTSEAAIENGGSRWTAEQLAATRRGALHRHRDGTGTAERHGTPALLHDAAQLRGHHPKWTRSDDVHITHGTRSRRTVPAVRVFLTGGTGYVGGEVARLLRDRGDAVRALVRDRSRAGELVRLGCEVVEGDLGDEPALVEHCRGVQAVVHTAVVSDVGASADRRETMVDVNVTGTERVLGAALTAGVAKAVHVSSVAVFGDTRGAVADERWRRDDTVECASAFEHTAGLAQRRAREISARGLPLVVVQSGPVYGPGEPRVLLGLTAGLLAGRLSALPFPELGICPVHRDDLAAGVLLALDKGTPGESYVLAGEPVRLAELVRELAEVGGRRPPSVAVPSSLLRALVPAGPLVSRALGLPPNLRELVRCSAGATYWASSDKAMDELGWTTRPLREGLTELVAQHERGRRRPAGPASQAGPARRRQRRRPPTPAPR